MNRPPRPTLDVTATCACTAVSVTVRGDVRAMLLCACEDCQRATGTGHSAAVLVANRDVYVTGATASFARPADSGATLTRQFCPACGTPVLARSSRAPDLAMLPAGLFAGQADWFHPSQVIFARSHRDWDTLPADLPRHATYRQKGSLA